LAGWFNHLDTGVSGRWRTTAIVGGLALLGVLAIQAFSPRGAIAASLCDDHTACFWVNNDYNGDKRSVDASDAGTGWHNFATNRRSAKSRFDNHLVKLRDVTGQIWCLLPGGNYDGSFSPAFEAWNVKPTDESVCNPD
jgi:hypothetical protein